MMTLQTYLKKKLTVWGELEEKVKCNIYVWLFSLFLNKQKQTKQLVHCNEPNGYCTFQSGKWNISS